MFKVPVIEGNDDDTIEYDLREYITWDPIDIEELHKLGEQHKFCPYYLNRMRAETADLVLMPYNYVSDAQIRNRLNINLTQDVLIIDEAHNIPQVIEDSSSFKFSTETFVRILAEVNRIKDNINKKLQKLKDEIRDYQAKNFLSPEQKNELKEKKESKDNLIKKKREAEDKLVNVKGIASDFLEYFKNF